VMAILAYRTYLKTPKQETEAEKPSIEKTVDGKLTELLVFKTSKQKTRLKATSQGVECYLEDVRRRKEDRQWTLSREEAAKILSTGSFSVNPGYKATVGVFSIGPRRNWLYSKNLFPEPDYLHGAIKQLLKNVSG